MTQAIRRELYAYGYEVEKRPFTLPSGKRTRLWTLTERPGTLPLLEVDVRAHGFRTLQAALDFVTRAGATKRRVGRPRILDRRRDRKVSLDDISWDRAVSLGDGNASEGIRIALARALG